MLLLLLFLPIRDVVLCEELTVNICGKLKEAIFIFFFTIARKYENVEKRVRKFYNSSISKSNANPDKKAFQTTIFKQKSLLALSASKPFFTWIISSNFIIWDHSIFIDHYESFSISVVTLSPYAWHEATLPTVEHADQTQELSQLGIQTSGVLWLICETCPQWPAKGGIKVTSVSSTHKVLDL